MDYSPPGSSVHEISQTRILEFLAISSSRGSFRPRDRTCISCIGRQILHCWAIRETLYMCIVSVSCSGMPYSLWIDPKDYNLPGSSVHGILQTRILEWVVISFTRGSSQPRDWTQVSCMQADSLQSGPPGKPPVYEYLIDPADLLKRHFHFLLWILVPFLL